MSSFDRGIVPEDRRVGATRLLVLQGLVAAAGLVLAVTFWVLQVAQHAKYQAMAEHNHLRTLDLRAPRGVVFDRHGRVLVANRYAFRVSVVPSEIGDLPASVATLAALLDLDRAELRRQVESMAGPRAGYRPVVIARDATLAQAAAVAARRLELPGVVIEQVPIRHYPEGQLAAHLFGHVGEITRRQLESGRFSDAGPGAIVGQSGLELGYNQLLRGQDGVRRFVVTSLGREVETIAEEAAVEGQRLRLTIDYDLQRAAEEAFEATGFTGAIVVLDPRSGEVLTLASVPAFDPNDFVGGIDLASWDRLTADARRPLQNRAVQGRYSPGSTFKVVVAVAALEAGVVSPDEEIECDGGAMFYGRYFQCHLPGGHGKINLMEALEHSCNVYFYTLGSRLSIDVLHDWALALGLGQKSGIDLPHEVGGLIPSRAWRQSTSGGRWYPGETISVSIGQGPMVVTPLSVAVMMATIFNGGQRPIPHVLQAVDAGEGWRPVPVPAAAQVAVRPDTLEAVRRGLWRAVNASGTARRARVDGLRVAGKTGTTQVVSLESRRAAPPDRGLDDHGWFAFFASAEGDAPPLAGAVLAEHADHGYLAAPIARHVLETYVAARDGRPLPTFVRPERAAPYPVPIETELRP